VELFYTFYTLYYLLLLLLKIIALFIILYYSIILLDHKRNREIENKIGLPDNSRMIIKINQPYVIIYIYGDVYLITGTYEEETKIQYGIWALESKIHTRYYIYIYN